MVNHTDLFIKGIIILIEKNTPIQKFTMAQKCVFDYLGVALAGSAMFKLKEYELLTSQEINCGCGVVGSAKKAPANIAALLNGISAHAIELDDGHRIGMLHLGAPIISALLAVAEKEQLSSHNFLKGIIIGYEVAIRLACCVQPGCKLKGYHATGTCGTVGATMAIATSLHFDFEQMKSAFSAAITSAAGVLEMIEGDTEMKPYNAGRAAMDGLTAAYIGKARFKAPEDALGGKRGFLKVMTDVPKLEYITNFDNSQMMIDTIYMKPYAACRHCHPEIEAALFIRKMDGFNIDEIEDIQVHTYKLAVAGHDHVDIKGVNSAKMSIPYSLAVALATGNAGLHEYSENYITDKKILDITKKVSVSDCDEFTALCPQKRVAEVIIKTKSKVFSYRVDYPKGEPENPISEEELETKFRDLAMFGGLTSVECDEIIDEIWKPEFDLAKIINILCKEYH